MTRNSHLKSTVRDRMERTGETYAEALRALKDPAASTGKALLPAAGYAVRLSPSRGEPHRLPYPATLTRDGYLFNGLWDYGYVIGFERAHSTERTIALPWREFTADPAQALGMSVVARDPFTAIWSAWDTPIETIEALTEEPGLDEDRRTRRDEVLARHYLDDPVTLTLSDGREWEVRDGGLLTDLAGEDDQPFATLGQLRRIGGDTLHWGTFMHEPDKAIGASVVTWTSIGVDHRPDVRVVTVDRP